MVLTLRSQNENAFVKMKLTNKEIAPCPELKQLVIEIEKIEYK